MGTVIRPLRMVSSSLNDEDNFFMTAVMGKKAVRLATFIMDDLEKHIDVKKRLSYLHYGMFLTKVFRHFKINLEDQVGEMMDTKAYINGPYISKCGYDWSKEKNDWVERKEKKKKKEEKSSSVRTSESDDLKILMNKGFSKIQAVIFYLAVYGATN
ncbi:MAG: hypothetical protein Q8807_04120, partial ['Waltheria sp.' little leaf phytoplasma]|nr:hypothetical protein ['Waltheria sp.' little leaf phytoplasma]